MAGGASAASRPARRRKSRRSTSTKYDPSASKSLLDRRPHASEPERSDRSRAGPISDAASRRRTDRRGRGDHPHRARVEDVAEAGRRVPEARHRHGDERFLRGDRQVDPALLAEGSPKPPPAIEERSTRGTAPDGQDPKRGRRLAGSITASGAGRRRTPVCLLLPAPRSDRSRAWPGSTSACASAIEEEVHPRHRAERRTRSAAASSRGIPDPPRRARGGEARGCASSSPPAR